MKVILICDDRKLGKKNSVIDVKDGYARFLVDSKKAVIANDSNMKKLDRDLKQAKETDEACRKLANQIKDNIESVVFIIEKSYNKDTNQLNGSITKNDVLKAIRDKFSIYNFSDTVFVEFPKTKFVETYSAKLKLYDNIIAKITFKVRI